MQRGEDRDQVTTARGLVTRAIDHLNWVTGSHGRLGDMRPLIHRRPFLGMDHLRAPLLQHIMQLNYEHKHKLLAIAMNSS